MFSKCIFTAIHFSGYAGIFKHIHKKVTQIIKTWLLTVQN